MATLTFGTQAKSDVKIPAFVARAITRIVEGWKETRRYDKGSLQKWTYFEENLTDPEIGPEIHRALR
jgi:hypothetical protein